MQTSIAAVFTPTAPVQAQSAQSAGSETPKDFQEVLDQSAEGATLQSSEEESSGDFGEQGDAQNLPAAAKSESAEADQIRDTSSDLADAEAPQFAAVVARNPVPPEPRIPTKDSGQAQISDASAAFSTARPEEKLVAPADDGLKLPEAGTLQQAILGKSDNAPLNRISTSEDPLVQMVQKPKHEGSKVAISADVQRAMLDTTPVVGKVPAQLPEGMSEVEADAMTAKVVQKQAATNPVYIPSSTAQAVQESLQRQMEGIQTVGKKDQEASPSGLKTAEPIAISVIRNVTAPQNVQAPVQVLQAQTMVLPGGAKEEKFIQPLSDSSAIEFGAVRSETSPRATGTFAPHLAQAIVRQDLTPNVSRQIAEAIHRSPERTVEITLSPAELGRVRLSMSPADAGLAVTVLAERAETLELMRRNIEALQGSLVELGYGDVSFAFEQQQGQASGDGDTDRQSGQSFLNEEGSNDPAVTQPRSTTQRQNTLGIAPTGVDIRI